MPNIQRFSFFSRRPGQDRKQLTNERVETLLRQVTLISFLDNTLVSS